MARAGSMGTGWHCSRRACFRTPQGFQLEAVCEMGAPRGRTSRGPITPAAPSPGEALGPAPPPQPRSAGCAQWPLCPVFIVEDTRTHTRGHPPPRPTPRGTPTAQQVWGAEARPSVRPAGRHAGGGAAQGPRFWLVPRRGVLAGPGERPLLTGGASGQPGRLAARLALLPQGAARTPAVPAPAQLRLHLGHGRVGHRPSTRARRPPVPTGPVAPGHGARRALSPQSAGL